MNYLHWFFFLVQFIAVLIFQCRCTRSRHDSVQRSSAPPSSGSGLYRRPHPRPGFKWPTLRPLPTTIWPHLRNIPHAFFRWIIVRKMISLFRDISALKNRSFLQLLPDVSVLPQEITITAFSIYQGPFFQLKVLLLQFRYFWTGIYVFPCHFCLNRALFSFLSIFFS